jgi:uncharacterized repeat protein (TIGR02543 family)
MNKQLKKTNLLVLGSLLALVSLFSCGNTSVSAASSASSIAASSSAAVSSKSDAASSVAASSSAVSSSSVSVASVDTTQPVVTYYYNYDGAPSAIYQTANFTSGHRVTLPTEPERAGFMFVAWYTDAALTTAYNTKSMPTASFSLYAKWLTRWTFEAEYVSFDGKAGMGYSANVEGTDMICKDSNGSAKASNGYYVSYLYYNGAFLEFDVTAAEAASNVYFVTRFSSEFYDMAFDDSNFKMTVNDTSLTGFYCDLSGALSVSEKDNKRPFTNFLISNAVSLNKGANVIKLTVNNSHDHGGTMKADAPLIDCLYLGTETALSWNPHTDNIS